MKRPFAILIAALTLAACNNDSTNPSSSYLVDAFSNSLVGFANTQNSFNPDSGGLHPAFGPGDHRGPGGPGRGGPGGGHGGDFGIGGGLMGGGLGGPFLGGGFGPNRGPRLDNCTYSSASGLFTCNETHDGLTITRTVSLKDASGAAQSAFDSAKTNTVNEKVAVSGTVTRRDGATSTLQHASDRTVSGLATGSTQRTINGSSAGTEKTVGTDSAGTFTVTRAAGDTTKNVVIPVATSSSTTPPYPTAGTVIRAMQATVTHGGTTTSTSRREVITYDGTSTAKVVITQDGTTKTCTVALPHGRLQCS